MTEECLNACTKLNMTSDRVSFKEMSQMMHQADIKLQKVVVMECYGIHLLSRNKLMLLLINTSNINVFSFQLQKWTFSYEVQIGSLLICYSEF